MITSQFQIPNSKFPIRGGDDAAQKGFIALSTVLIVLVVVLAITLTSTYTSLNEAQSGFSLYQGDENLAQVEGCVEEALLKARYDATFGDPVETPVNINRPSPLPTCVVTVNSKQLVSPFEWDMDVTVDTTAYKRIINVEFTRGVSVFSLNSWREI